MLDYCFDRLNIRNILRRTSKDQQETSKIKSKFVRQNFTDKDTYWASKHQPISSIYWKSMFDATDFQLGIEILGKQQNMMYQKTT